MCDFFQFFKDIYQRGVIYCDVKFVNFLYDYENEIGVFVDFGFVEVSFILCSGYLKVG